MHLAQPLRKRNSRELALRSAFANSCLPLRHTPESGPGAIHLFSVCFGTACPAFMST